VREEFTKDVDSGESVAHPSCDLLVDSDRLLTTGLRWDLVAHFLWALAALMSVRSLLNWSTILHHFGGTSGLAAALLAMILVALLLLSTNNAVNFYDLVGAD